MKKRGAFACILMALSVATLTATPAGAQVDFSGEWGPRFWEDQPRSATT